MKTNRLEAFSDGVIAIIITIMVLELKIPEATTLGSLLSVLPIFLSYVISFIYLGIYWNNHHHLFQITEKVNGKILWANLHLLFWLSLIPFSTSWMGENHLSAAPVAFYGMVLFMNAIAYHLLQQTILHHHKKDFVLRAAIGKDLKGKVSVLIYLLGIGLSFFNIWTAIVCYVLVAVLWFVPDQRIEKRI